jgi:hypothetical protein
VSGHKTPRRVCRLTASAILLAISLLPILLPMPLANATTRTTEGTGVRAAPSVEPTPSLTVSLTAVTPTVALPKAPITLTGSVRNNGLVPIASPVARAHIGQRPLTSRQAVTDWAAGTGQQTLAEVARAPLGGTLLPDSVTTFVLVIPATAISHRESFAVLPLSVDVVGTAAGGSRRTGSIHTFIPTLSAIKAYEPLSVAWLVPLTLDPDPALQGMDSPARTAAWARAIGPGSRLDRLIEGTESANVTWAIDPAILGPRQPSPSTDGSAVPDPTPSGSTSPTQGTAPVPDPVTAETTALAQRLKAASPRHTLWALPYADPDLSALLPIASGNRGLADLISRPSTLDAAVGPARTDIAWPLEKLTPANEAQLRRAYNSPGLAAAVTSDSTLTDQNGSHGNASRKSSSGLPLLAYDHALSATVAKTSSRATGAVTIQQFLADSMALLGERPGTRNRSVLIAEPRTFAGDPAVLRALFAAVAQAPWLTPTTTGQLLVASGKRSPDVPGVGNQGAVTPSPTGGEPAVSDPLAPGTSPLTADQLATTPSTLSAIAGIASILGDGRLFAARWTDAQVQRLSARWRGHPGGIIAIDAATAAAINTMSRSVRVAPSSVNFLADRGVMQVTVVNDLAVPVHDVHLTLRPAQPRLRIERQPGPLKIGAKSRTNVPLQVTSIAAGLVSVEAVLTTRNGTPLGQNTSVDVRVQPPGTWLYWVLGGLAGMVLVLGTYRSLRRGSTRGSRPEAQEQPLHDRVLND